MVNKYAAQFASYLNSSVIVFTNQSHEDYLNMMIEQEKVLASKNGNYELVERLKDALKEYKEQKEFLENQIMASNNASQIQFSVEDVNRALADLCAMKHSGSTIKDILDKDIANPMTRHANLIRQQYEPNQPKGEIKKGHVQRMIEFFMQYWN
jgi:antitoxin component HigA of HigAB toxin-antitoxin module